MADLESSAQTGAVPIGTVHQVLSGRYRLVERLGAGGMSVVWAAFDEVLQRPVAVKLPAMAADDSLRHRIRHEARAAARLVHPHIASVFDYGETESDDGGGTSPYVVMELVTGAPLSRRLAERGRLPWREAATICARIAAALAEAHANDVVHRDIKPGNVLLTAGGVKLVDFGIAAAVGDSEGDSDLLGTPAYMAPERLARTVVGSAADVYGLGVMLYRAIAGRMPWDATTVTQVLAAHLIVEPAPLPDLPDVPAEVTRTIEACLAKEPGDRPSSVDAARTLAAAAGIAVPLPDPNRPRPIRAAAAQLPATLFQTYPPPGRVARPRWLRLALGTVGAFAVTAVLATVTAAAWGSPGGPARLAMLPQPAAEPFQCGVNYLVEHARQDRFDAVVEVIHSGGQPPADAVLRFAFPGDQTIADVESSAGATQQGREVATGVGQLPAGGTVTLRLPGTRGSYNPMPTTFYVNEIQCTSAVSGPPPAASASPDGDRSGDPGRGRGRGNGNSGGSGSGSDDRSGSGSDDDDDDDD